MIRIFQRKDLQAQPEFLQPFSWLLHFDAQLQSAAAPVRLGGPDQEGSVSRS